MIISLIAFFVSLVGVMSVFVLYPLAVWVKALFTPNMNVRQRVPADGGSLPHVSVLVVVRNGAGLIAEKIENSLSVDYPASLLEVIVFSDGSTDETEAIVETYQDNDRVRSIASKDHVGKTAGINRAALVCAGDVIVLSDADALLDKNAVRHLVAWFDDPSIGGVCGQRVISEDRAELKEAQHGFIRFDSWVKMLESRTGSISSNDGKIYAIRRDLFRPIAQAVTDDLYTCLSIVRQGFRFVFEPRAIAYIRVPSRNQTHELRRRRRIVCRGLRGIYLMKELLNPMRYGLYSVSLFFNKVVRRLLPVLLVLFFASSLYLATYYQFMRFVLFVELAFLALAATYPVFSRTGPKRFSKLSSLAYYFCLGNMGTLLGLVDFLLGKKIVQWNPVKEDAH